MHILGNFHVADRELAPVVVAICFDTLTRSPQFVLAQECDSAVPYIVYGTTHYEVNGLLDDMQVETNQPSDGGGIIRRSANLNIKTEHAKGYPFYSGPLDKKFYQAGTLSKDFYFALYAIDRRKIATDIKKGLFLGYYQMQSGASWNERDGVTTIPLVDVFISEENIVAATEEVIPDSFFLYNPWFDSQIVPKVYGQVPRVKMLNSFPSFNTRDLSSAISGRVESTYTAGSATILLEKYANQSSVLRQLISIGGSVRVRMADGEVILGTLAYNSGTGEVTLTVTTRNTYYGKAQAYTYAGVGQDPTQWASSPTEQRIPQSWSMLSSVILDGKNKVQDPNGWMQATLEFFNSVPADKADVVEVATQMQGWDNEASNVIKHAPWVNAGVNSTLSFDFSSTVYGVVQTGMGPVQQWTWNAGPYLKFLNTTKEIKLYFRDPATPAAGGAIGSGWSIVGIEPASVTYECYIRNGFSHFENTHVFAEGDGRLIKIPTANVVSVTDSTTVGTLAGMAKIVLTASPMEMNIGATSNVVYTDALYRTGTSENRTERILYEILKESSLLQYLVGSNIASDYTGSNWLPYIGCLIKEVTSITALVDRLLFQVGATLRCAAGVYYLGQTGYVTDTETTETISAQVCIKPVLPMIDQDETLLESASISMGQVRTKKDSQNNEFVPLYLDIDYGAWEDPFYKPVKSSSNRAIRPYDRKFNYAFDLLQDPNSVAYAAGSALSIGHPSGFGSIERSLSIDCTLYAARFEALDPVIFKNFPLISTADETNALFAVDGTPCYVRPSDSKKFIMGSVCQLSKVVYNFSVDSPKVVLEGKMTQLFTQANGLSIYSPPYPPNAPPSPSVDPNAPPNLGGGYATGFSYNGNLTPMDYIVSAPAVVTIDSLVTETTTFTITVDDFLHYGGSTYSIELTAPDGQGTTGISITGNPTGVFATKTSDAYVPTSYTVTVSCTYALFAAPVPSALVSRSFTLKIYRTTAYGSFFGLDFGFDPEVVKTVTAVVNLQDLSDITAS